MLIDTNFCPCKSGLKPNECCLVHESPLIERNQGFSSVDIQSQLVDDYGNQFIPLYEMHTNVQMRKPQQLSHQILELLYPIREALNVSNGAKRLKKNAEQIDNMLNRIDDSLHAVQYHKRQFLFRLRLLTGEELLLNKVVSGNVTIEMDDMPLRYEFESFISRIRTTLDVIAKLIALHLGNKNVSTNGKLYAELKENKRHKGTKLYNVYMENEHWIVQLKKFRDSVQHDGDLPGFKSFEYEKGYFSYPKLNELTANHVCFTLWSNLMVFLKSVLEAIFPDCFDII